MAKMYDGFKVVRVLDDGSLYSLVYSGYDVGDIRYIPGQWTKPYKSCGPLAVFTNLDDAKQYMSYWPETFSIKPCKYYKSRSKELWFIVNKNKTLTRSEGLPVGTDLACRVMILDK